MPMVCGARFARRLQCGTVGGSDRHMSRFGLAVKRMAGTVSRIIGWVRICFGSPLSSRVVICVRFCGLYSSLY